MKKIIYLKSVDHRQIKTFMRLTDENTLYIEIGNYSFKIEVEEDVTKVDEYAFYTKNDNWSAVECTQEEFDAFYKEAVSKLNSIASA